MLQSDGRAKEAVGGHGEGRDGSPGAAYGELMDAWRTYKETVGARASRFPELLAVGYFSMVFGFDIPETPAAAEGRSARRGLLRSLWARLRPKRPPEGLPGVDVLLFASSNKPNFGPPMDRLGELLTRRGISWGMLRQDRLRFPDVGGSGKASGAAAADVLGSSYGWAQSVWAVIRATCAMTVVFASCRRSDFRGLHRNPLAVWVRMVESSLRFGSARFLYRHLRPKVVIVNNERVPGGAELVMTPAGDCRKILFYNEHPDEAVHPVFSDEIFVWNDAVKDALAGICGPRVALHSVGNAQIDFTLGSNEEGAGVEAALAEAVGERKVFIYLSNYLRSLPSGLSRSPTEEAVRWMAEAARELDDWAFVYKSRHGDKRQDIPGIEYVEGIDNFHLSVRTDYYDLLRWKKVRSVGALRSTGLFVAAGVGKKALRFDVSDGDFQNPAVTRVSRSVRSSRDLVRALSEPEEAPVAESADFPHRGRTAEAMCDRVCAIIREGTDEDL